MACYNCPHLHKTTALSTAGLLTVTNSTNVGNFDKFCLLLTICPNSVITGAAVPYTVTVNGANIPILDKWGYPITTDRLCTRKLYLGRYIESDTPHITLVNACGNITSGATVTSETTEG